MNPWPFVGAAYLVTLAGTGLLTFVSWRALRRAERKGRRDGS